METLRAYALKDNSHREGFLEKVEKLGFKVTAYEHFRTIWKDGVFYGSIDDECHFYLVINPRINASEKETSRLVSLADDFEMSEGPVGF